MICHVQWYTIQTDKNKNKEMIFLSFFIIQYYIMKDIDKVDKYQNKSPPLSSRFQFLKVM